MMLDYCWMIAAPGTGGSKPRINQARSALDVVWVENETVLGTVVVA